MSYLADALQDFLLGVILLPFNNLCFFSNLYTFGSLCFFSNLCAFSVFSVFYYVGFNVLFCNLLLCESLFLRVHHLKYF